MLAITEKDKFLALPLSGRDPLGTQPIWQYRARDVVPHLTAASRRAEGFHILLIAIAWWPEFATRYRSTGKQLRNFFILLEQAFARACRSAEVDWRLPGRQRLYSREPGLWIGLSPDAHLLDNQLANGVWGLYRGPAIQAKLITEDNHIASEKALQNIRDKSRIVEEMFKDISKALSSPTAPPLTLASRRTHRYVVGLSEIVSKLPFKSIIKNTFVTPGDSPITSDVATLALKQGMAGGIASFVKQAIEQLPEHRDTLTNIVRCEQFLAPIDAAFEYICGSEHTDIRFVAADIPVDLKSLNAARSRFRQSGIYSNLARKRSNALLGLNLDNKQAFVASLISHHAQISKDRRTAPWISVEENGRLDCRLSPDMPAEWQLIPEQAWRYSYYLGALGDLHVQIASRGKQ
ncbi:hypothetical protein ACFWP0_17525 [Achromobacter sp. NPDC058515]|uniref:hypothetical protein n=1 Tax=Achromobacter sp. NPDC058515 TaxID=3346533 RepID=UPI00364EB62B